MRPTNRRCFGMRLANSLLGVAFGRAIAKIIFDVSLGIVVNLFVRILGVRLKLVG